MTTHARARSRRRGLTLIITLVCLVVATSLCLALMRQAQIQRSVVRRLERQTQAEWLAESGLARAASRLAGEREYSGEAWQIPAAAFDGREAGVVRIAVTRVADQPDKRRVRVEADYPSSDVGQARARQSKTLIVELGPDPPKGPS